LKIANKLEKFGAQVWNVELPMNEDPDSLKDKYRDYFYDAKKVSLF
jgi:hypothetical protein